MFRDFSDMTSTFSVYHPSWTYGMRKSCVVLAACLVAALDSAAQVQVSGSVGERDDSGELKPVAEAYVLARAGSPEAVVAEAVTDARGRYRLAGLPLGRVALAVDAQGYYTVRAGELDSETIARSCRQEGDCGQTDFELARAAVVEGELADAYGDPVQGVEIALTPEGAAERGSPMARMMGATGAVSDDRGRFRVWGVKPGRYELTALKRPFGPPGGPPVQTHKQTIEIGPRQQRFETRITLRGDGEIFQVRGTLSGVDPDQLQTSGITVLPIGENADYWMRYERVQDGKFSITGLGRGDYVLRLADDSADGRRWIYLDTVHVDRDITGLALSPQPPTGVRGRIEFVDSPPANQYLAFTRSDSPFSSLDGIEVTGPDYAFEHAGLAPAEYELVVRDQDYYLVDNPRLAITFGRVQELTLRVSNQRSAVRGTVRLASGETRQAAAHFTVGLRGERGRHGVQSDDAGAFVFEKLVPGEYEIAAWAAPDADVHDDERWRRAGDDVKRLVLEPGFETEIDLTVSQ